MNLKCPHCGQVVEVGQDLARNSIACPRCRQSLAVPESGTEPADVSLKAPARRPRMHVPLQPIAATTLKPARTSWGCGKFLLLFLVVGAGAFGYAMYRWDASPKVAWNRLTTAVEKVVREKFAPAPAPSPEAVPTAQTTARPDPIAWLIGHREHWPKEVILRAAVEFPAVSGGKMVGSLRVPAGVAVKVNEIAGNEIEADYFGGTRRVPITDTDLLVRAREELAKAEWQSKTAVALPTRSVPDNEAAEPEKIREATREEIRTGLGALYTHQATTFRIFAPTAKNVSAVLYDDALGEHGRYACPLRQEANNLWDATVRGDLAGKCYTFLIDGNDPKRAREVLDPYAVNSVASSTRARITPLTDPVPRGPRLESPTDAIIYEMHVRDFTIAPNSAVKNSGLYLGWTEAGTRLPEDEQIKTALDHLSELGVTDVELMPVQDFDNDESSGSYNWGYITSAFFSPEGMFATNPNDDSRVRELKALINALHSRGIGVIMDVVYNHTAGNASLMSIAP
ncbi:MAG TPA: alpha-amylase family glycosyl hydrolase, partial [Chthoniobacterales bacterium]|nr:alpha-amylase family glycosyl hydrolase [Chthoniobacterales bacterium]